MESRSRLMNQRQAERGCQTTARHSWRIPGVYGKCLASDGRTFRPQPLFGEMLEFRQIVYALASQLNDLLRQEFERDAVKVMTIRALRTWLHAAEAELLAELVATLCGCNRMNMLKCC